MRGPILALHWWLTYALSAFPRTPYICKADDDVFVFLPAIALHLRAFPHNSVPYVYYGSFSFFHVKEKRPSPSLTQSYSFHAYAPTHFYAQRESKFARACNSSVHRGVQCAGPFPYANGPFLALGRALASALSQSRQVRAELDRLRVLPPNHPLIVEDVWLGAALWRHVGSSLPVHTFSLSNLWNQPHPWPKQVYMDTDGCRVSNAITIFHNRRKFVNRVFVLHEFTKLSHCSILAGWRRQRRDCCNGLRAGMWDGRLEGTHMWPNFVPIVKNIHSSSSNKSSNSNQRQSCAAEGGKLSEIVDLRNASELRRLGILERLPSAAQADLAGWLRRRG
ncbi:MAG: hypothetical protein SGPRY_013796 [Prymnesium sp.]